MKTVVPIYVVYSQHVDSRYPEFLAWFFDEQEAEDFAESLKGINEYVQIFAEKVPGSK